MPKLIPFNSCSYLALEGEADALNPWRSSVEGRSSDNDSSDLLSALVGGGKVLLTPSCTAALEMTALLTNCQAGDEVIIPSNTFVSTASAFVLRGATPVFVDCNPKTLNMDVAQIDAAITPKTRGVVPVHYAGVGCAMDEILALAHDQGLFTVEDAAQGVGAFYKGKPLGAIAELGCFSFHATKNIICGEGGALVVNHDDYEERAEILHEKGTDRSKFLRGEVDKYTWVDLGSSFVLGELPAAFLRTQLRQVNRITENRLATWSAYYQDTASLEAQGLLSRPHIPDDCQHNGHMFYVLLDHRYDREQVIKAMLDRGVQVASHYVPLHSSPAGRKFGRFVGDMKVTNDISQRLIRLPLYYGLSEQDQATVMQALDDVLRVLNT